jgi:rhodanese-related sulfurtransferase
MVMLRGLQRKHQKALIVIVVVSAASTMCLAQDGSKKIREDLGGRKSPTSYCGIYCLYAAMKLSGQRINCVDLLTPRYVSSPSGSSLADLRQAALDHGLHAAAFGRVTRGMLRECGYSVILHVRPDIKATKYSHYILFIGAESGKARIFDPPNPVRLVPFPELAALWDGSGLIVSAHPVDLSRAFAAERKRVIPFVTGIVLIVLSIHWMHRHLSVDLFLPRRKRIGLCFVQTAVLCITTLTIALLYHFVCDDGLLANAQATMAIQQAHGGNFISKIGEAKVRNLLSDGAVLIDARYSRDYQAGHLDGALNLPVDANDAARHGIMSAVRNDSRIVIYCQSKGCKFAEKIAVDLIDDGFSHVSIFRGGWNEWIARNGNRAKDDKS